MLGRKDYTQEELDQATRAVKQQLAAYRKLVKALNGARRHLPDVGDPRWSLGDEP